MAKLQSAVIGGTVPTRQGVSEFGLQPLQMFASDATARELVATESGAFGADLLRFPPGGKVPMHKHVGDHILIVIAGIGTVATPDGIIDLSPGTIYLVPSEELHEIHAMSELVLVAIGNDRRTPDSPDRLELTPN